MADAPADAGYVFPAKAPTSGFASVWGFLDGVGGAAQRVGGIVDVVADGAEDVARGRAAVQNQRLDTQERELGLALRLQGFERGDNKLTILAVTAAAVALIVLMK